MLHGAVRGPVHHSYCERFEPYCALRRHYDARWPIAALSIHGEDSSRVRVRQCDIDSPVALIYQQQLVGVGRDEGLRRHALRVFAPKFRLDKLVARMKGIL